VAEELSKNRYGFLENYGDDVIVTLSSHRQPPSIKGVARLVIESDTSGRRYSYYARQENIRSYEIGMPIKTLSERSSEDYPTRKILEIGVNTIWALRLGGVKHADPNWAMKYCSVHQKKHNWEEFWERIRMLEHIGALWYEPWIFDSNAMDAEPLF